MLTRRRKSRTTSRAKSSASGSRSSRWRCPIPLWWRWRRPWQQSSGSTQRAPTTRRSRGSSPATWRSGVASARIFARGPRRTPSRSSASRFRRPTRLAAEMPTAMAARAPSASSAGRPTTSSWAKSGSCSSRARAPPPSRAAATGAPSSAPRCASSSSPRRCMQWVCRRRARCASSRRGRSTRGACGTRRTTRRGTTTRPTRWSSSAVRSPAVARPRLCASATSSCGRVAPRAGSMARRRSYGRLLSTRLWCAACTARTMHAHYSPTAPQPHSPTAPQSHSPTAARACSPAARSPQLTPASVHLPPRALFAARVRRRHRRVAPL